LPETYEDGLPYYKSMRSKTYKVLVRILGTPDPVEELADTSAYFIVIEEEEEEVIEEEVKVDITNPNRPKILSISITNKGFTTVKFS
jgi:hypothetical protein